MNSCNEENGIGKRTSACLSWQYKSKVSLTIDNDTLQWTTSYLSNNYALSIFFWSCSWKKNEKYYFLPKNKKHSFLMFYPFWDKYAHYLVRVDGIDRAIIALSRVFETLCDTNKPIFLQENHWWPQYLLEKSHKWLRSARGHECAWAMREFMLRVREMLNANLCSMR